MKPKLSVIVCTTPRSGSSFLCQALNLTKVAGRFEEWLNLKAVPLAPKVKCYYDPGASVNEYLEKITTCERSPNGVFGIKLMFSHLLNLSPLTAGRVHHELIREFFPDPRFIYLRREDTIKQAVSFAKALQSGVWNHPGRAVKYDASLLCFHYPMIAWLEKTIREENRQWERFFRETGVPVLSLSYEDLVKDCHGAVAAVMRFCGIRDGYQLDLSKNQHRRMADSINAEWRGQFEETRRQALEAEKSGEARALPGDAFRAAFEAEDTAIGGEVTERFRLPVRVTNKSPRRWPAMGAASGAGWMLMTCRWLKKERPDANADSAPAPIHNTVPLPRGIAPGETAVCDLAANMPAEPGEYFLEVDLRQHKAGDFKSKGNPPLRIPATVSQCAAYRQAAGYFGVSAPASNGALALPWLGVMDASRFPKVCHRELGWLHCSGPGAAEDSFFFYFAVFGWMWTSSKVFPYFKCFDRDVWYWYQRGSQSPCYFANMDTKEWVEL